MSTNLTIDDSSLDIIYSYDWAAQAEDDPNTDRFFQATYHSAQGDGASANITFTGSAIYMYGTKGPGHANYSVQFDNFIVFFSASALETSYQQLLFERTFNTSGPHFVSLTSRHVSSTENWLDLDYITITVNDTDGESDGAFTSASASATSPTASPTISPPWLSETSSTGDLGSFPSSPSTTLPSSNSDSASTNQLTLILAAVFGSILAASLIFGAGWVLARRRKRGSDDHLGLRAGTPGAGSGGAGYGYKPPPSPSFFGGQLSPISPEPYSAQSPAYDGLLQGPEQDKQVHGPGHGHLHGVIADGRKSPHSTVSLGGATVLTTASTAYLLNSHLHKVVDDTPGHRHSESTSTAVNRLDAMNMRARSPLSQPRRASPHLPIYKQHRVYDSESAINVLRGSAAAAGVGHANDGRNPSVVVPPGSSKPSSLNEKSDSRATTAPDSHNERPAPLMALHAAHRSDTELPMTEPGGPNAPPRRPKRPGDGLLDFIGSQLAQRLERSASAKRRRDDANSERTNFLKV